MSAAISGAVLVGERQGLAEALPRARRELQRATSGVALSGAAIFV